MKTVDDERAWIVIMMVFTAMLGLAAFGNQALADSQKSATATFFVG